MFSDSKLQLFVDWGLVWSLLGLVLTELGEKGSAVRGQLLRSSRDLFHSPEDPHISVHS